MSKLGGFLARKPAVFERPTAVPNVNAASNPAAQPTPLPDNPLELDEELFSALGAKVGGENESLRNLLLDANSKIGELDSIKSAFDRLVDPVSKALRAYEAEKSEKTGLQTMLNNTRTAYGKLRNEAADLEKKATAAESEGLALRQELAASQNLLKTAEATKAEIAIDVAARRAQIVDLEGRLAHEGGQNEALREENRRLDERLIAAEKRIITLDSDINAARQRLAMARALAYEPRILLLDEATSSLDVKTEYKVQRNLASLLCTQIIIAHRLSTVRYADLILVMDKGEIVERGTHDELLARDGVYAELIRNQLVQESPDENSLF